MRWRIRKNPNGASWAVYEPEGRWSGDFLTWPEALQWATELSPRVEYWLANQSRKASKWT